jgi:hypothetical protein
VHYQWFHDGEELAGATASSLVLTDVLEKDAGGYTVTVFDAAGATVSARAHLQVDFPAAIFQHPVDTTVTEGQSATLLVDGCGGVPVSYQWKKEGMDILGATNATLDFPVTEDADTGTYTVALTSDLGTVTSLPAELLILIKPAFTSHPQSQTAVEGDTVVLSTTVSGTTPFGYRWRRNGRTVVPFEEGQPTLTLTNVQMTDAGRYTVVVTNRAILSGVLSKTGQLTVLEDTDGDRLPDIWEEANGYDPDTPGDGEKDVDGDGMTAREEYVAGTDPNDETSYLNLDQVTRDEGITQIEFLAVSNKSYTVQFKESAGHGVWTRLADVLAGPSNYVQTVIDDYPANTERIYRLLTPMHVPPPAPGPVILLSPRSQSVYADSDVMLSVEAFGAEPLTYRWRFNERNIPGATEALLSLPDVQTNAVGTYAVVVEDENGSVTSQPADLVVLVPPVISSQPQSQTVGAGQAVTFRVGATGFEPLSYWWYFNGARIPDQKSSELRLSAVTADDAGSYSVVVRHETPFGPAAVWSDAAVLDVTR